MPVDSAFGWNPIPCDPETEDHRYLVHSDGSHEPKCICGKVVVLTPENE